MLELEFRGIPFKYYARSDDGIADQLYYRSKYSEDSDLFLFAGLAKRSSVVFDIGANTGLYSIISAKVNPSANIYAFEPHPVNAERLEINTRLNALSNVTFVPNALGKINSEIDFYVPASNTISDSSSAEKAFSELTYQGEIDWKPIKVQQITISEFLERNTFSRIDLIKIDVEGYEMQVFEGAESLFERFSPTIVCEIFLDEIRRKFFDAFIRKYQYTAYCILSEGLVRLDEGIVPNYSGLNYLFSKKRLTQIFTDFKNIDDLMNELVPQDSH